MDEEQYRQTIRDTCDAAGVPDMAGEMTRAGVAATTLKNAIADARRDGASDVRAAIRAHQGVAARLQSSDTRAETSAAPAAGWDGAAAEIYENRRQAATAAPAPEDADQRPAAQAGSAGSYEDLAATVYPARAAVVTKEAKTDGE